MANRTKQLTRRIATDELDPSVLLSVVSDVRNGDFSVRMSLDWTGVPGKIADRLIGAVNSIAAGDSAYISKPVQNGPEFLTELAESILNAPRPDPSYEAAS